MKPVHHTLASLAFSSATYAATRSPWLAVANFTAGVFIDIDHIPEFLVHRIRKQKPIDFLREEMHLQADKFILPLHGFDLITLLFLVFHLTGYGQWAWVVYIGFFQHLLLDTLYNPVYSPFSYFLIYRALNKFKADKIFYMIDTKTWQKKKEQII